MGDYIKDSGERSNAQDQVCGGTLPWLTSGDIRFQALNQLRRERNVKLRKSWLLLPGASLGFLPWPLVQTDPEHGSLCRRGGPPGAQVDTPEKPSGDHLAQGSSIKLCRKLPAIASGRERQVQELQRIMMGLPVNKAAPVRLT